MDTFNENRDCTTDVFCIISKRKDKFIYANKAFEDLWGTPPKSSQSALAFFLEPILPEDRPRVCNMLSGVAEHENKEYRIFRQDRTIRWIRQRMINISANVDDVYQICFLNDITEDLSDILLLSHRLKMEDVVGQVAADLIQTPPDKINQSINRTLKEIGVLVQADRSYLFQIDNIANSMSNTHEWCRDGISAQIEFLQDLPLDIFPWAIHNLQAGIVINVPDVQNLTDTAEAERTILQMQDILSVLLVPVMANKVLIGFIGFDNVAKHRIWAAEDIVILQLVAELISSVIQQLQNEVNLAEYDIRVSMALAATSSGLFDFDVTSNSAYLSPEFYATLGFTHIHESREVPLEMLWSWVYPADLERVQKAAEEVIKNKVGFHQCFRIRNGQDQYCWYRLRAENLTHPLTGKRRVIGVLDEITQNTPSLLTKRESEILHLLERDLAVKEIAHELAISSHTVDNHLRKIYAKLGTQTKLETVLRAHSQGLLYLA